MDPVTWHQSAVGAILTEAPRMIADHAETGGFLFGYQYADDNTEILVATGPGPKAQRSWWNIVSDSDHAVEERTRLREQYPRIGIWGHWHTHPWYWPKPTDGDHEAGWAHAEQKRYPWVEAIVIVSPEASVLRIRAALYMPDRTIRELPDVEFKNLTAAGAL